MTGNRSSGALKVGMDNEENAGQNQTHLSERATQNCILSLTKGKKRRYSGNQSGCGGKGPVYVHMTGGGGTKEV